MKRYSSGFLWLKRSEVPRTLSLSVLEKKGANEDWRVSGNIENTDKILPNRNTPNIKYKYIRTKHQIPIKPFLYYFLYNSGANIASFIILTILSLSLQYSNDWLHSFISSRILGIAFFYWKANLRWKIWMFTFVLKEIPTIPNREGDINLKWTWGILGTSCRREILNVNHIWEQE